MFGKVAGSNKGQDMGLQAFQVVVVINLHGRVLDRAIHPLGLAVGPRM